MRKIRSSLRLDLSLLPFRPFVTLFLAVGLCLIAIFLSESVFAGNIRIPGTDSSDKLEAAGTLLRIVDTALFKWGARVFAGLSILSAGWHLKDQRFGLAVISVIGAIVTGTSPMWVRNIFEIGGGSTLFSYIQTVGIQYV